MFLKNKGKEIDGIKPRDYARLKNLMNFCLETEKGRILGVRDNNKKLVFGIFLIETEGNITMLFVVNTRQSRESRIGYYIVNELIRIHSGTKTHY